MMKRTTQTTINGMLVHESRGGVESFYVPDTLGNLTTVRSATGVKTYGAEYWPYGEIQTETGTNPSSWGFVGLLGYLRDTASRLYVRARHYRPGLARWQTVDPLWPDENAYGYVGAAPVVVIDSTGTQGMPVAPPVTMPPVWWPSPWPAPAPSPAPIPAAIPVIIIGVGIIAIIDLGNYACTGRPGPVTGIGVIIGEQLFPNPGGQNAGERDPDCTDDIFKALTAAVWNACKAPGRKEQKCNAGMSPDQLRDLYLRNLECARARANREGKCWNGGNSGHKHTIRVTVWHAKCCKYFMNGGKGDCPHPAPQLVR
jgi:RHS repeat-associated protein